MKTPAEVSKARELNEAWDQLVVRLGLSYFLGSAWVLNWWRHLAREPKTEVAFWFDDRRALVAVGAISWVWERIHHAIPVGIGYWTNSGSGPGGADHLGFVASDDYAYSVERWMTARHGAVVLRNFAHPPSDGERWQEFERTTCIEYSGPMTSASLGGRSTRKTIRWARNKLDEQGVVFDRVVGSRISDSDLGTLFYLHARRFEHKSEQSVFDASRKAFLRGLIENSTSDAVAPYVIRARQGSEVIGVLFGFLAGKRMSYYQSGWDPDFARLSLGRLLVAEAVDFGGELGVERFEFLRGDEAYKRQLGGEPVVDRSWIQKDWVGRLLRWKRAVQRFRRS